MSLIRLYCLVALPISLSLSVACSNSNSESTGSDDASILTDTGGEDGLFGDLGEPLDGSDDGAEQDGGVDIPIGDRLPYGDICTEPLQCIGNLCLRIEAGLDDGFCSGFCFEDEDCPDDEWSCIFLSNSGGDASFVCAPDNLCIDQDEDGYGIGPGCVGPDCEDDNPIIFLGADEHCDGIDNDCDGNIDDNPVDANVDCATGFPGQCSEGLALCIGGFIECESIRGASTEVCDTVDNDCDGVADESATGGPFADACYGGLDGTLGVGLCTAGFRGCEDGVISSCVGQILPLPEVCDGLDNDCDGSEDEGNPGTGVLCETELEGVCRRGMTICGGGASACGAIEEPSDEICDGLDNDCDGVVDESVDEIPLTRSCYGGPDDTLGVGTCTDGVQTCDGGEWNRCLGEVTPSIELCSTDDEDCDGLINEGNPASGFLCETGEFGLCAFGRTDCAEGGVSGADCIGDFGPTPELCDGFDNDCDDEVDESTDGETLSRICYDGVEGTADVGLCSSGVESCPFGDWSSCVGQVLPTVEICDAEDNDCDGEADEGHPGAGIACTTGLDGMCARGASACSAGSVVCAALEEPSEEICDGHDNDCDGETDEGELWDEVSSLCFEGEGLCRAGGVLQCNPADPGGGPICSAVEDAPSDEICDGADNDCDGDTDEDEVWSDLGTICNVGDGICQRAGVRVCDADESSGPTICAADPGPAEPEICDGLDNDCDGETDENPQWADAGVVCFAGDGICRRAGVLVCDPDDRAGDLVCGATAGDPDPEVCDGADNDCDGATDEGALWDDVGTVCVVGDGVCQRAGIFTCDGDAPAGPSVCSASPGEATGEICDGLDNDCDGTVDQTFPTLGDSCVVGDGVCRAAGVVVCDGSLAVMCDAVPPDPIGPSELCDYLDDDCDGTVDEDFRDESGRYSGVDNCGGCGVDCNGLWLPSPDDFHVVPMCNTFIVVSNCGYDCEAGWFDLDLDPSNGCEFEPDDGAVYVTTADAGGSDVATCGAWDAPCAGLQFAVGVADVVTRPRVRVSDGLWTENVTMRSGISLLGGHNSINWVQQPETNVTVINGINSAVDNATVIAADIISDTEVSGFTITAAPGRSGGGNSIGIHVVDSDESLLITGNRVFAASGGAGAVGDEGSGGSNGSMGTAGTDSVIVDTGCSVDLTGGAPGALDCGATTVSGGIGGDSECPVYLLGNDDGDSGSGLLGGIGGTGGGHLRGSGSTCNVSAISADASDGLFGAAGTDGPGGGGATADVGIDSTQVRAGRGLAGTDGTNGSGGGGGGAGAGVEVSSSIQVYYGAAGGGGGSGGCAGDGGLGGGAGGGSFPILVVFSSTPADSGSMPEITLNHLTRGQGGQGGSGGNGGPGGEAGAGSAGGSGVDGGAFGFCMFDAGAGAEGGRGGHGGGGGGGAGGQSFDVFVWNAGGADPGYDTNTFVRGTTDTAGGGGSGGLAVNPDVVGDPGSAGAAGTTLFAEP